MAPLTPSANAALEDIEMGVLSRRIFHSPLVKWIYPARIRDEARNDVAFVGETTLRLKEWNARAGMLVDVASIENFSARIRGVAVLGERKTTMEYANAATSFSKTGREQIQPPQILVLVLENHQLALVTAKHGESRRDGFLVHSRPTPVLGNVQDTETHIAIDAHARAMAFTNSDRFIVIYGLVSSTSYRSVGLEQLIETEVILPFDLTVLKMDFIHPLREDSEKVMLLLVGMEDSKFVIYVYMWDFSHLIDAQSIQIHRYPLGTERGYPLSLIPIQSKLADGYFVLVEEEEMVLFRTSTSGSIEPISSVQLRNNSWDELQNARHPGAYSRAPLWNNWARPMRNPDWQHEVIYLGREDGAFKYVQFGLSKPTNKLSFEILGSGGILDCNIGTAMAVLETEQARRDGSSAAESDGRNFQDGYPDALLVASTSGDGGLYEIGYSPRAGEFSSLSREESNKPRRRATIPNWGPFFDITVVESVTPLLPHQVHARNQTLAQPRGRLRPSDRLFAAGGEQPYGAVCELRYGFSAPLVLCKDLERSFGRTQAYEKYDLNHCNGVWLMKSPHHSTIMLFSYAWCSILACVNEQTSSVSDCKLFEYDETTLDMQLMTVKAPLKQEQAQDDALHAEELSLLVCVCPTHVRLLRVQAFEQSQQLHLTIDMTHVWNIPSSISATFGSREGEFIVASPNTSENMASIITLKRVLLDGPNFKLVSIGHSLELDSEITSMTLVEVGASRSGRSTPVEGREPASNINSIVALGTVSGSIHFIKAHREHGLGQPMAFSDEFSDTSSVRESNAIASITALRSAEDSTVVFLLCSSRDGVLQIIKVQKPNQFDKSSVISVISRMRMPPSESPVRVMRDPVNYNCGYVHCGKEINFIDLQDALTNEPLISSVFFTDPEDQSYSHGSIDAFCHTPAFLSESKLSACLIAISGGKILVGRKSAESQALPLRRLVPGTPTRIIYSQQWRNLVVASTTSELCVETKTRYSSSTIFRMDPNIWNAQGAAQSDIDYYDFARSAYRSQPGERILDLMEMFIHREEKVYHFIVATTIFLNDNDNGPDQGRIVLLNGQPELTVANKMNEKWPVFAINQTANGSLIYCSGCELSMRVYDQDKKRFQKHALDENMPSPGVEILIRDSFVIVATKLHSLVVYKLDEDSCKVEKVYNDTRPRMGISCLDIPDSDLILMPSMLNTITGFWGLSRSAEHASAMGQIPRAVFEIVLPSRVTRLVTAVLQPPWKRYKGCGVREDNIYGITTDGSLFSFSVLESSQFKLLRFIQLMCLRDARICPFPSVDAGTRRSFELQKYDLKDLHVDGDILCSLLKMPCAEQVLREMLDRPPPEQRWNFLTGAATDYESAAERKQHFSKFVLMLKYNEGNVFYGADGRCADMDLGREPSSSRILGASDEAETVIRYLKTILDMPL